MMDDKIECVYPRVTVINKDKLMISIQPQCRKVMVPSIVSEVITMLNKRHDVSSLLL